MEFRDIQPGEIVMFGDEWFDDRDGCWEPCTSHTWGQSCPDDMRIRRRL